MKDKIAHLMKMERLTTSRLAELLEIQPSAVSHLVSGRNNPRFDLIKRILRRFPRVNPDWLLLDDPIMYRDESTSPPASDSDHNAVEGALFEEDDILFSNIASTEPQIKAPKIPLMESTTAHAAAPQPVRVMVLYSDGSFESYSLR